ncbi:MAG: D-alanyl-D-alanine carboxypeptidase/D-alanyl-D-alanine-endopeptidase [Acidobacteria bacterium]|nr:MAG: D-alanyl-D-alanine carboxypeptidase/D-alanyl-D-alanine-endopeptidase [Acidobacteriota bacterium]
MPARKGSWAGRGGDSTLLALILNPSLPLVFKHSLSLVLLPALLLGLAPRPARAAQTQSRERRATTRQASSATTPAPAQTPARPTPTPATTPAATQTPTPSATTPARQASAPQTLEELRARLREIIARPEFASSRLAVKVASLDTGRVLTVAAALDRLTPDYRFVTSVYAATRPDPSGTIRGDLTVYGRGDPSYATRFNPEGDADYYRAIGELASNVARAGVRRVEGDLVGDESYFGGPPLSPGWEWDDLQWWYGAEVSALTVNDNSVDLSVKPGARVGDPCVITVGPSMPFVTVVDRTTTAERGTRRDVSVHRALGQNTIEVRGTLPLDDRGLSESVAVSHPALMFTRCCARRSKAGGSSSRGRRAPSTRKVEPTTNSRSRSPRSSRSPRASHRRSRSSPRRP